MIKIHRLAKCIAGLAILMPAIAATPALGSLAATASITTSQSSAPFNYVVTLHNTGTSGIGTFWFAWTAPPNENDFLPTSPTGIIVPTGWIDQIIHDTAISGDGYSLEMYNISGSAIAPGAFGTFKFTSSDTPAQLAGNAFLSGHTVGESVIYGGFPESDAGATFTATVVVPEPASFTLLALGACTMIRRRSRFNA